MTDGHRDNSATERKLKWDEEKQSHRIFARSVLVQAMCQQKCRFLFIHFLKVVAERTPEVLRC